MKAIRLDVPVSKRSLARLRGLLCRALAPRLRSLRAQRAGTARP